MKKHLFLTGPPGIGKTTLCKKLALAFHDRHPNQIKGFYTEEVRSGPNCKRIGFDVVAVKDNSTRATLARELAEGAQARGPKISKYTVDVKSFEQIALPLISCSGSEATVIVIDEIGKMELFSHRFKAQVMKLFEIDHVILLCTVPIQSVPFVSALKNRPDVEIITVTKENRDSLQDHLSKLLISKIS